jgi:repressor of nif and glnA expression
MIMVKGQDLQILGIVAKLAHNDVNKEVLETDIIEQSELPESEVRNHLNELEWLHLTKETSSNANRAEFRLWNITEKGLQELSSKDSG